VQSKLELEWSPEQIARHLRRAHPDRPAWHVCHETIYQALYAGKGGLLRWLTKRLRTGRPLCKRRRRPDQRKVGLIAPSRLIDHRPAIVLQRARVGVWEGDLIVVGRASRRSASRVRPAIRVTVVADVWTDVDPMHEHLRRRLTTRDQLIYMDWIVDHDLWPSGDIGSPSVSDHA
jgi:IS30 family transposase